MKAKALFITDTHLTRDNIPLVEGVFRQARDRCLELGIKDIICGGDVFTSRSGQPLGCLVSFSNILSDFKDNGITFHVIAGNHDKTDGDDDNSYISVYRDLREYAEGGAFEIDNLLFVMMPYYKEEKWLKRFEKWDALRKKMEKKKKYKATFLITHIGFDGVMNNDGSKVESTIKPSMFSDYTAVLIGHYHNASTLGANVYYTGSAYQNNFGETADDKGYTIIYEDGTMEREQTDFPLYIKVPIDAGDKEALEEAVREYGNDERNYIRFVFSGTKDKCEAINRSELATKYGIDSKFEIDTVVRAMELSEHDELLTYDAATIAEDFEKFCLDSSITTPEVLNFGRQIIKTIGQNVEA